MNWFSLRFIDVCYLSFTQTISCNCCWNNSEKHIRTALWLFPLYLLLNIFVFPIAWGGNILLKERSECRYLFLLIPQFFWQ
jgi:Na+/proline symporter